MPIDYSKYPKNWESEIRPSILKRANHECESCGVRNYSVGYRKDGRFFGTCGNIVHDLAGQGLSYPSLNRLSHGEAKEICAMCNDSDLEEKYIVIILTIAHLDHNTENNDPSNLKALCQKCHLNYDKELHLVNRRATIEKKKRQASLF